MNAVLQETMLVRQIQGNVSGNGYSHTKSEGLGFHVSRMCVLTYKMDL